MVVHGPLQQQEGPKDGLATARVFVLFSKGRNLKIHPSIAHLSPYDTIMFLRGWLLGFVSRYVIHPENIPRKQGRPYRLCSEHGGFSPGVPALTSLLSLWCDFQRFPKCGPWTPAGLGNGCRRATDTAWSHAEVRSLPVHVLSPSDRRPESPPHLPRTRQSAPFHRGRGQDAGRHSGGTSGVQHLITVSHNLICVYVPLINVKGQRCFGCGVESFL